MANTITADVGRRRAADATILHFYGEVAQTGGSLA